MFLDVTFYHPGVADEARKIIQAWIVEHAGYYGTPHGRSGGDFGGYGFGVLTPEGGSWLTSGHNYHALQIARDEADRECVRLTYSGRRHGMQRAFIDFLQKHWRPRIGYNYRILHAYLTQQPEWQPWETLDDHDPLEAEHVEEK